MINGIVLGYTIRFTTGQDIINDTSVAGVITNFDVFMLSPFTDYVFEVAAMTGAGSGDMAIIMIKTDEDGRLMMHKI